MVSVPDNLIWHYTSATGLEGILRTRGFYASHYASMNDASELTYADARYREVVEVWAAQHGVDAALRSHVLQPLEWFSSRRGTVFLVSFSRSANDLSQWRAYGGGSGFALGFSETISLSAERYRDTVDDVRYGRAEQSALVTTALDELLKVSRDDASLEGRVGRTGNLQDAAVNVTRRTLPFLKNPAFGVERERRVAFLPPATEMRSNIAPDGVLVRVRNGRLLRYVEARWDEPPDTVSPLRAIMIGPGQSPSVADDVRDLLRMCQLRDVEILWSEIPLRG